MKFTKSTNLLISLLIFITIVSLLEAYLILKLISNNNPIQPTESPQIKNDSLSTITPFPSPSTGVPQEESSKIINKDFSFPIKDVTGETVTQLKYLIKDYQFTNDIIVNNVYSAKLKSNLVALVINIDLTNNYTQTITINPTDYVRLLRNNSEKLLAPDIDDKKVEIKPQSTKEISLGFTLNKSDTNLKLQVGDLEGQKETLSLK